jgi:hypothetical protein
MRDVAIPQSPLRADARVPRPVELPDAEDRLITQELENRREFPVIEVMDVLARMSQRDLIADTDVVEQRVDALLSENAGLETEIELEPRSDSVSITPLLREA